MKYRYSGPLTVNCWDRGHCFLNGSQNHWDRYKHFVKNKFILVIFRRIYKFQYIDRSFQFKHNKTIKT